MRVTQSVNEHGLKPRAGRRQRRIGMTMLIAGIIVLVAAFAPTSANAVIPNSSLTPTGPESFNLSCTDNNDPTTATILTGVGLNPFTLPTTIATNAINSPSDSEQFTLTLTATFTLPASLVSIAQATGNTSLVQTDSTLNMTATGGATGSPSATDPGPTTINLPAPTEPAVDISFQSAPADFTFTRSGTGTPVMIAPVSTTATSTAGAIPLLLRCTPPAGVAPLTLNDVAGPPPPPTTQPPPSTLPPVSTTTAPPGGGPGGRGTGTGGTSTGAGPTATSATGLARTGFHAELLYLGIALLGAGYALSLAGRRVARASARSS